LTGAKQPEHLEMLEVSPNYFSMLGTTPEIGGYLVRRILRWVLRKQL
jgi:hypothetical protein